MAELVLEVENLRVIREGVPVVEDVSFQLPAESDTALVGPNGAGKSTLVAALLGFLPLALVAQRLASPHLLWLALVRLMAGRALLLAWAVPAWCRPGEKPPQAP